jgi:hypothetical protein
MRFSIVHITNSKYAKFIVEENKTITLCVPVFISSLDFNRENSRFKGSPNMGVDGGI